MAPFRKLALFLIRLVLEAWHLAELFATVQLLHLLSLSVLLLSQEILHYDVFLLLPLLLIYFDRVHNLTQFVDHKLRLSLELMQEGLIHPAHYVMLLLFRVLMNFRVHLSLRVN